MALAPGEGLGPGLGAGTVEVPAEGTSETVGVALGAREADTLGAALGATLGATEALGLTEGAGGERDRRQRGHGRRSDAEGSTEAAATVWGSESAQA